jgi:hypothetical protein
MGQALGETLNDFNEMQEDKKSVCQIANTVDITAFTGRIVVLFWR